MDKLFPGGTVGRRENMPERRAPGSEQENCLPFRTAGEIKGQKQPMRIPAKLKKFADKLSAKTEHPSYGPMDKIGFPPRLSNRTSSLFLN